MPAKKKASSLTKAQLCDELASKAGLSKTQVNAVLDAMGSIALRELSAGRKFSIPDVAKLSAVHKNASSASTRKIGANTVKIPAKPAHLNVNAKPVPALKEKVFSSSKGHKK